MMKPELKTKWISALRSGNYQQGRLRLKSKSDGQVSMCCLGVLADIVDPDGWSSDSFYNGREDFVWREISIIDLSEFADRMGLSKEEQNSLMYLNDTKEYTFEQIADYLEFNRTSE